MCSREPRPLAHEACPCMLSRMRPAKQDEVKAGRAGSHVSYISLSLTLAHMQMVHEVDLGGEVDSLLYVAAGTAPGQGFLFVGHMPGFFKNAPQQQGQGRGRELRAHDFDGCVKVYNTATGKEQLLTGHRVRLMHGVVGSHADV